MAELGVVFGAIVVPFPGIPVGAGDDEAIGIIDDGDGEIDADDCGIIADAADAMLLDGGTVIGGFTTEVVD